MNFFFIKTLIVLIILSNFISCATASRPQGKNLKIETSLSFEEILDQAETNSTSGGRKVLEASRTMISNREIVPGACWNYINKVYNLAGYSSNQRVTIFKSKLPGPYVKADQIEAGDWLYFVNHSYGDIDHSAIFVAWTDEEKKIALMVSYVGGNQKKPALYKKYILTNVYNIIRAHD
jgi:hypothetical protein